MPGEIVAIVIVMSILTFIGTIIRSTQQYKLKKYERERGTSDDSLTTSELRRMIEEAVDDATSSLQNEIAVLNERLGQIEEVSPRLRIDEGDGLGEKTVGRPIRQRER
jgi:hypothetical protein